MSEFFPIAAAVCAAVLLCSCSKENTFTESFFALDTAVTVTSDRPLTHMVREAISDADKTFSKVCGSKRDILTETDAQRINFCLDYAEKLNSEYNGKLDMYCGRLVSLWGISEDDPKVPSEQEITDTLDLLKTLEKSPAVSEKINTDIELGAAVKGYAADMAKEALDSEAPEGYIILSAESSVLLYGEKDSGFKIGVKDPLSPENMLGSFTVPCGFVSTSGGYERYFEKNGVKYSHILDTETGYPVNTDLTSVTVYCELTENGGLRSDLLSTLIYCEGTERLEEFAQTENIAFIAADKNKNIYVSGLDFQPQEGSGYVLCRITDG